MTHVLNSSSFRHRQSLILGLVALVACSDSAPTATPAGFEPALAAGGKGPTVQVTDLGGLTDGQSFAHAVNTAGVIVGGALTARNGVLHAARWTLANGKPVLQDLTMLLQVPTTHASVARGINDQGAVVGWRKPPNGPPDATDTHAFLLTASGQLIDLQASPLCSGQSDGKNSSRATAINNLGEVVGDRASNPNPTGTSLRAFY